MKTIIICYLYLTYNIGDIALRDACKSNNDIHTALTRKQEESLVIRSNVIQVYVIVQDDAERW
jgi:hypothetical protein